MTDGLVTTSGLDEFLRTYAECTGDQSDAMVKRRLNWKSDTKIPLKEAAVYYAQIEAYNEFESYMISRLWTEFQDDGIEVTVGRDYSVVIYLHIPDFGDLRTRVRTFIDDNFNADEIDFQIDESLRIWWD